MIISLRAAPDVACSCRCQHCHDTGHAGGNADDPNECGFCDTLRASMILEISEVPT